MDYLAEKQDYFFKIKLLSGRQEYTGQKEVETASEKPKSRSFGMERVMIREPAAAGFTYGDSPISAIRTCLFFS